MLWQAKNGRVSLGGTTMDYLSFGTGPEVLVVLPGLGDGLTTAKGMALPMALTYRSYARCFKVYMFSRKNDLEEGCSTRDMARDQAEAMARLGIRKAHVLGVSQGGMIAQHLAIDHPELVEKLVLTVTLARQNPLIQAVIRHWMVLAEQGDHKALMVDTAERSYSPKTLQRYRFLYPLLGRLGRPKDYRRFLLQAAACLSHDAFDRLGQIACPTLVLGGGEDRIVGPEASVELAGRIPDSQLFLYEGLGHAAYEEAKDFHPRVQRFLLAR